MPSNWCWTCRATKSICCEQRPELQVQIATQVSKSDSLSRELSQSTCQIASHIKQIKDMESRLSFLRLEVDIERASSGVWPTDVAVFVQDRHDEPLAAHKFILGDKSPVFRKMFETEMQETDTGVIRIDDASFATIRAVIRFCYSAQIDFTDEVTAEDVLPVAHKYGIDLLQKICEEHLIITIDNANLPGRLKLAKKFEDKKLQSQALEYLKKHFDEVTNVLMDEAF